VGVGLVLHETSHRRLDWLCGSDTENVNPDVPLALNLLKLSRIIASNHRVTLSTPSVLVFDCRGYEISLFAKGRMLIKNVHGEDEASEVSRAVSAIIERAHPQCDMLAGCASRGSTVNILEPSSKML
jgi:ArsR family metal-binding transcriptional regulator